MAPEDISQITWNVRADNRDNLPEEMTYRVIVDADNTDSNEVERKVEFIGPPELNANITLMEDVESVDGRLEPNPFRVQAEINNSGESSLYGVEAELILPPGLVTASSEKAKKKGVAIALSYSGGVSLGLLKPYYLDLFRFSDPPSIDFFISSEKYSEENRELFLTQNRIYGSSGFARGLGEIRFRPGGHAKFGVNFDWGAFDQFAKSLEAGVMVDFFFQKVPIMVEDPEFVPNTENRFLFVNFFVNLQLGKRR